MPDDFSRDTDIGYPTEDDNTELQRLRRATEFILGQAVEEEELEEAE